MRVLIIDDDPLVCESLKTILQSDADIDVLAVGYDGASAVRLYRNLQPAVLLMDIRMEAQTGLEAASEILGEFPQAKILFLTTFCHDDYIVEALRLGAKGYILKQDFESILPALKAVWAGQSVFGDTIVAKMPELMKGEARPKLASLGINEREESVIALVAQGRSNKEIAEALYLSEGTVRNYISVILDKLELRDRTQLAVFYLMKP